MVERVRAALRVVRGAVRRLVLESSDGPGSGARRRELYRAGLAAPGLAFPVALLVWHEPIGAGVAAMGIGALARVACRPDLLAKTVLGGLMFLAVYVLLLESLAHAEPGYVDRVWSPVGSLRSPIAGLPASEILFGAAFNAYWSGFCEQWHWTFALRAAAPTRPGAAG